MRVVDQKKEIIDWVLTLEDEALLNELYQFKQQSKLINFEEELKNGMSILEFKAEIKRRIRNYPLQQ